jgi:cell division protein ZapA
MAEVTINLNGRSYEIACDAGQEGRVVDLAAYIDQRLSQIARSGAAYNDAHLLVLTSLVLADELFEIQEGAPRSAPKAAPAVPPQQNKEEEQALVSLLDKLTKRIDGIAQKLHTA